MLSLIVAMSVDRVIGAAGQLPWRLSADLRRFRRLTTGHAIVMGRKTYDSIGRPLPDRRTIVVSRQENFSPPGALVAGSIDDALRMASASGEQEEVFIIGGAEIFRQTLARADCIYMTLVHATISGDTWFPEFDESKWRVVEREDHPADDKNEFPFSFLRYERV